MSNDADSRAGHTQGGEDGIPKRLISLTLPLLSLQWALLPTVKSSFERDKDAYIKAVGNFAWFQIHALGMTLDPTGRVRSRFGDDLEDKMRTEVTRMLEMSAAGAITWVEFLEVLLPRVIKRMNDIKNEHDPKHEHDSKHEHDTKYEKRAED